MQRRLRARLEVLDHTAGIVDVERPLPERETTDISRAQHQARPAAAQFRERVPREVETDDLRPPRRVVGHVLSAAAPAFEHPAPRTRVTAEQGSQGIDVAEAQRLLEGAVRPGFLPEVGRATLRLS